MSWNTRSVRILRRQLVITPKQRSLMLGTLLGDASLSANAGGKRFRFEVRHGSAQREYVLWKYEILRDFVLSPPAYYGRTDSWRFRTITHPSFTELHNKFYQGRKKILPDNLAEILRDPLSLAVWFMDDGTQFANKSLTINTQSFTKGEQLLIAKLFKEIYGWHVTLHRDHKKYRIYLGKDGSEHLKKLITPYIIPTLRYKIDRPRRDFFHISGNDSGASDRGYKTIITRRPPMHTCL